MGRALIRGIAESTSLVLSAAIDKPGLKSIGEDSGLSLGSKLTGYWSVIHFLLLRWILMLQ